MNELQIFKNQKFGEIRVVEKDGDPWFVAVDVCRALGLEQVTRAMDRLDDDERGLIKVTHPQSPTKMMDVNAVNEPGLYHLVLCSNKPEAKSFKRWITHDVIPSIRKRGMYATESFIDMALDDPDTAIRFLTELKEERIKRKALEAENEHQRQVIADYEPKVRYCDLILQSKESLAVTQIAADYGISAKKLNKILHEEGIQHKVGRQWVLYRDKMGLGYTKSETIPITRSNGDKDSVLYTKWTQSGRLLIHQILEKRGIHALMDISS